VWSIIFIWHISTTYIEALASLYLGLLLFGPRGHLGTGESLARGPKLLSIKYVIEIMT